MVFFCWVTKKFDTEDSFFKRLRGSFSGRDDADDDFFRPDDSHFFVLLLTLIEGTVVPVAGVATETVVGCGNDLFIRDDVPLELWLSEFVVLLRVVELLVVAGVEGTSFATFFLMIFFKGFLTSAELSVPLDDEIGAVTKILFDLVAKGDVIRGDFCLILVELFCLLSGEGGVLLPKGLLKHLCRNLLSLRLRLLTDLLDALLISEPALGDLSKRCIACKAPFKASMVLKSESFPLLGVLDLRVRSVGPTLRDDLRKSLFGNLPN